jgi:hypothetical protein
LLSCVADLRILGFSVLWSRFTLHFAKESCGYPQAHPQIRGRYPPRGSAY